MSLNDQDKITIAREYFIRADQGRPDILELFHENAEIYFPKFAYARVGGVRWVRRWLHEICTIFAGGQHLSDGR
jgi:hypothetical protein